MAKHLSTQDIKKMFEYVQTAQVPEGIKIKICKFIAREYKKGNDQMTVNYVFSHCKAVKIFLHNPDMVYLLQLYILDELVESKRQHLRAQMEAELGEYQDLLYKYLAPPTGMH